MITMNEKWAEAEREMGWQCDVRICHLNVNGRATCDEYTEDHCFKKLYHDETDSKRSQLVQHEDGYEEWVMNRAATGEETLVLLEPWVSPEDIPDNETVELVNLKFVVEN